MGKFQKRITKSVKNPPIDCLVVGQGFGHMDDFLHMFNTVFWYGYADDTLRAKNLIYRPTVKSTYDLRKITAIFFDLDQVNTFESFVPLLVNPGPDLFVEGDEVIPRTVTKDLYQLGYRAIAQLGECHQWSKI
jgi:hypothetical protein